MGSELNSHKTQILVAVLALIGVLGGALISNWEKFSPRNQGLPPKQEPPSRKDEKIPDRTEREDDAPPPTPLPTAAATNISSAWLDNWGTQSQVTQQGETFRFTAWGVGCAGAFQSSGSGTIRGNRTESTYQTAYSHGSCSGTVSPDGRQLTQTCKDSVCGQFQSTAVRQ
jgi:hypothetical protein